MVDTSRSQRIALGVLLLVVLVFVLHGRVALGSQTWDDVRYHTEVAPPRLAAAQAVLAGEAPTWWDGSGLGVPLLGEPSHGAAYPLTWLGASSHALDLLVLLHLAWLALGVALWARRLGASELACLACGVLVGASGIAASTALRGALPALAHLPWVGWAATSLAAATSPARARRVAALLGLSLGAVGLAGQLGLFIDALVLAALLGARRAHARWLLAALVGGIAISSAQWLPALAIAGDGVGSTVLALKPSRLLELVLPGSFGSSTGARAVDAIAGKGGALPSLFIGAPALALAALARPSRRVLAVGAWLALAVLVIGRPGPWPTSVGAPELHLAVLVVGLVAHAGRGIDALIAHERRAFVALATASAIAALALIAAAILRSRTDAVALDRTVIDGGISLAFTAAAAACAWRKLGAIPITALLVIATAGTLGSTAPLIGRDHVTTTPLWAIAATKAVDPQNARAPLRLYRPISMYEDEPAPSVADSISTLVAATPARFELAAARSEDPARPPIHDRLWLASSSAGGAFLERYGIQLAILPLSMGEGRGLDELARRGNWILAHYPATPPAAMFFEWLWLPDEPAALARLFPPGSSHGLPAGLTILDGAGREQQEEPRPPEPCTITRWARGAIDLTCASQEPSYAVVSSTNLPGWTVEVDGKDTPWLTADLMRRAVALGPGAHVVSWRYVAPNMLAGAVVALLGLVALLVLAVLRVPREPASDEN